MNKITVNYDEVMRCLTYLSRVRDPGLEEIEWVRDNGDVIEINERLVKHWKFVGLSNDFFAETIIQGVLNGEQEELLEEFADLTKDKE